MSELIHRLRKRAEIRRQIATRKSVQEGKPDRIADLLEEAASVLKEYEDRPAGIGDGDIQRIFRERDEALDLLMWVQDEIGSANPNWEKAKRWLNDFLKKAGRR